MLNQETQVKISWPLLAECLRRTLKVLAVYFEYSRRLGTILVDNNRNRISSQTYGIPPKWQQQKLAIGNAMHQANSQFFLDKNDQNGNNLLYTLFVDLKAMNLMTPFKILRNNNNNNNNNISDNQKYQHYQQ